MLPPELINHILLFSDIGTIVNTKCSFKNNLFDHLFWLTKFSSLNVLNYNQNKKSFIEWVKLYKTILNVELESRCMLNIIKVSNMKVKIVLSVFNRFFSSSMQKKYGLSHVKMEPYFDIEYTDEWSIVIYYAREGDNYSKTFRTNDDSYIVSLFSEVIMYHKTYHYNIYNTNGQTLIYDKLINNDPNNYILAYKVQKFVKI